jgi:hypothetical protein
MHTAVIRSTTLMLFFLSPALTGCGGHGSVLSIAGVTSPMRDVELRLALDGKPIHAAHVRAVAIDSSSVALPVSGPIIEEALYAWGYGSSTDEQGIARLRLYEFTPHLIEVSPSPFSELADEGPWRWTINAERNAIHPMNDPARDESCPILELVAEPHAAATGAQP